MIEIIFLGNSSLQTAKNFCTSFLVKTDKEKLLVEVGPGIIGQLLKLKIPCSEISAVLVSHAHFDHFLDTPYLFFVRFAELQSKQMSLSKLPLISTSQVFDIISYIFKNCYPKIPLHEIAEFIEASISATSTFKIGEFEITTIPVKHTIPTVGCKIKLNDKVLVYSSDTIYGESLIKLAKRADVLIHEALASSSNPFLVQVAKKGLHGIATEAGKVAGEAEVKKLVLVHKDPLVEKEDLISDAKKFFSGEVIVAEELEKIFI